MLTNEQILAVAPSVFTTSAHPKTTAKYNHFSTIELIEAMRGEGWGVVSACEARVRLADKKNYQTHTIRFQHPDMVIKGEAVPGNLTFGEAILRNSHYGDRAYNLEPGLRRFICGNGASVPVGGMRFSHISATIEEILAAQKEISSLFPQIAASVERFQATKLDEAIKLQMAKDAAAIRWGDPMINHHPVRPEQLLATRRPEDEVNDLYTVFNVIQENLIKGGLEGTTTNNRKRTTRAIKSAEVDILLNKKLWNLADKLANSLN